MKSWINIKSWKQTTRIEQELEIKVVTVNSWKLWKNSIFVFLVSSLSPHSIHVISFSVLAFFPTFTNFQINRALNHLTSLLLILFTFWYWRNMIVLSSICPIVQLLCALLTWIVRMEMGILAAVIFTKGKGSKKEKRKSMVFNHTPLPPPPRVWSF